MPIPQSAPLADRTLLRDDVYQKLRDAIVDGTFEPGEQLKDASLAEWLGVSRTPVREALLRLGSSGLVVTQPGRSTTVSAIDSRMLQEARDVVASMHELAVRETVGKLSDAELERMRTANRRFEKALAEGNATEALQADDELHAVPVKASRNRALQSVLDTFGPVVRRAELLRFRSDDGAESLRMHERLIELSEAGDVEGAMRVAFDTWHSLPDAAGSE
ncbi:GntR family transcriptional regulator [Labedella endophytica]|uniref:GntR family transcriptional regulator n=1 Tax=Labedella endophytica TaxID=1523160 RepID=A0A3S0XNW8_9MICO|nr:GntR family transcriptional regulator [Labedella endophytica]RUR01725.1 GntR family transcriptional regulator [Labedella endophytica]